MSKLSTSRGLSSFPIINITLIALNILIFIHEKSLGESIYSFIHTFGLIPAKVFSLSLNVDLTERFLPFVSSMFIHGDWLHVIGNMIFLYIFGSNVEVKMGHFKYLIFYVVCGLAAALFHVLTNLGSLIPMVGASGAISGVLGAYITLFPISEFRNPVPIFFLKDIRSVPAAAIIFLWLVIQFLNGIGTIDKSVDTGGVAFWAHIGGFVAGLILVRFFYKQKHEFKEKPGRYYH